MRKIVVNFNISSHFMAGKTDAKNMMQFDQIYGDGQKESETMRWHFQGRGTMRSSSPLCLSTERVQ